MQFWSKMKYSKIIQYDWWHEIQQKWISISRCSWIPQVRGTPPLYQVPAPGAEAPVTVSPPYSLESNKKEQF